MKSIKEIRENVRQYLSDHYVMDFDTRISHLIPEIDCKHALLFVFSEIRVKDVYKASNPFATVKVDIDDGSIVSFSDISRDEIIWKEYKPNLLSEYRLVVQELFEIV